LVLFVLAVVAALGGSVWGADTVVLDLSACLAAARQEAPRRLEAAALQTQAAAAAREVAAATWPLVSVAATGRYTSEVMERALGIGPAAPVLRFGDGRAADLTLGAAVPLYTGGEIDRQHQAASLAVVAATQRQAAVDVDIARDTRCAYCLSLGRQAQLRAARLAVERLERHGSELTQATLVGGATEEARLRLLIRLREAQGRQVQAAAALDSAGLALGRLVGRPGAIVVADGGLEASLLSTIAAADLGVDRVHERPDVAAALAEVGRQEALVQAVQARFGPRVAAEMRGHYGRPGVDQIANDWTPYLTAGLVLDWPLWDAGARREQLGQARARVALARARGNELLRTLLAAHATAAVELAAATRAADLAREQEELQARLCDLVRVRLHGAAATQSEYLDAAEELAAAQVGAALAWTRVRLAEAVLLWTLGY
jgi:outer membrane protein TolC